MDFVIHWHEPAVDIHVFPIPIPPPTSLSTRSLWVFPVHQAWELVSCIQPGLVICFTLDNIHVSMLFSWNIPPSPSPTESICVCVDFFAFVLLFVVYNMLGKFSLIQTLTRPIPFLLFSPSLSPYFRITVGEWLGLQGSFVCVVLKLKT